MAVNVTGTIYVDVEDYQDEIEIHADVEDIYELMMDNGITSADMIEYLKNGESSASEDDVMKYIEEDANHDELFAIQAAVFARLRHDFKLTNAERTRIQNELATDRANAQSTKTAALQCIEAFKSELPHDAPLMNEVRRLDSMFN